MTLNVFGFEAEGDPQELALFTLVLTFAIKKQTDIEKKKEVDEWMKKYGDKTFEELMKTERDDEE